MEILYTSLTVPGVTVAGSLSCGKHHGLIPSADMTSPENTAPGNKILMNLPGIFPGLQLQQTLPLNEL